MQKFSLIASAFCCAALMMSCTANSEKSTETAMETNAQTSQAVIENIMTRTSIREFTSQPVSKDTLDLIVKAGMAAPSAMDKRPWAFVVVTEREVLDSLNAIKPWFNLKTATAAVIVCGDLSKAAEGEARDYWVQDCSAVTENMLLAAHAYGLGAVWCGVYPIEETMAGVSGILGLPSDIIPLDVVTLGYPAESPEPKDKFDPARIHYQRW